MINQYMFIVEGIHDSALISKILTILGYLEIKKSNELISPMNKLILRSVPNKEERVDLYIDIPYFYKKENNYVSIINANGEQNLLRTLDLNLKKMKLEDMQKINKIVTFCDGDLDNKEEKISKITNKKLRYLKKISMFDLDSLSNNILRVTGVENLTIQFEFFVFPNNKDMGRLEDVLLESIDNIDKELLKEVKIFLEKVPSKYKLKWSDKNSKLDKAKISCLGSVLHPGTGNNLHIRNSDWVSEVTVNKCKNLNCVYRYIENILDYKV